MRKLCVGHGQFLAGLAVEFGNVREHHTGFFGIKVPSCRKRQIDQFGINGIIIGPLPNLGVADTFRVG